MKFPPGLSGFFFVLFIGKIHQAKQPSSSIFFYSFSGSPHPALRNFETYQPYLFFGFVIFFRPMSLGRGWIRRQTPVGSRRSTGAIFHLRPAPRFRALFPGPPHELDQRRPTRLQRHRQSFLTLTMRRHALRGAAEQLLQDGTLRILSERRPQRSVFAARLLIMTKSVQSSFRLVAALALLLASTDVPSRPAKSEKRAAANYGPRLEKTLAIHFRYALPGRRQRRTTNPGARRANGCAPRRAKNPDEPEFRETGRDWF